MYVAVTNIKRLFSESCYKLASMDKKQMRLRAKLMCFFRIDFNQADFFFKKIYPRQPLHLTLCLNTKRPRS
jgi:hypothetical protein